MSEMTTAEMVEWCKASAAKEPNPMAAMCFTEIAARLSALDKELTAATARAEKAEAERDAWKDRYDKAWAECEAHRDYPTDDELGTGDPENENVNIIRMARLGTAMDDHDAERREAGL